MYGVGRDGCRMPLRGVASSHVCLGEMLEKGPIGAGEEAEDYLPLQVQKDSATPSVIRLTVMKKEVPVWIRNSQQ